MLNTYSSVFTDDCTRVDYAHGGTGFLTWHRQCTLWFEWEIQGMLSDHTFRIPYWDWRREQQLKHHAGVFIESRLGKTNRKSIQPIVEGDLFSEGWDTICWFHRSGDVPNPVGNLCDPTVNTGPLCRCPTVEGADPCNTSNPHWPSSADVRTALSKPDYDMPHFDENTGKDSFRNSLEGFEVVDDCDGNQLCTPDISGTTFLQRHLHNAVSFSLQRNVVI